MSRGKALEKLELNTRQESILYFERAKKLQIKISEI